jgi:DNA-binding LacI/PurR family transcriptional regulator
VAAARPTIVDVARHAGVSKGLVSFALNNRPGVAADTRRRILASARELGWTPSRTARGLSLRTAFALGLVVRRDPSILAADPFFPHFIAGVESVLAEQGRSLVLSVVRDEETERRAYQRLASERRVDGVFLTDLRTHDERFDLVERLSIPAVAIGQPAGPVALPKVAVDDRSGIAAAVRHLAGLGHRRIAHVAGDLGLVHGQSRYEAFTDTMTGLGLDPTVIETTDFSTGAGATATRALLDRRQAPTSIVYASDPMALAGLGTLTAAGLRVPDDLSIVGFDGSEIGAHLHPALSTVSTDPDAWGARAAQVLLTLVAEGRADDVDLSPGPFLARGSSGPPPS